MKNGYWRRARETAGNLHRELRVALTPVPHPDKWLFLVGCYNSGTTLLDQLLSAHPHVSSLPTEGHFLTDQFVKDYEVGLPRMWVENEALFRLTEDDSGPDATRIKKEWGMRAGSIRSVFLEKSPPNTPRARWLQKHFAPAYFVSIVRNGYAVAEGIARKAEPYGRAEPWPIARCAAQWRRSIEILEQDAEQLERLLWVRYEDLAKDPAAVLSRIYEFVGLDPMADNAAADSNFAVHERNEPIRNMNQESFDRLSDAQIAEIDAVCGDYLEKFGYTPG
jgi:hypothetical protein